jgi:hypothetical protein
MRVGVSTIPHVGTLTRRDALRAAIGLALAAGATRALADNALLGLLRRPGSIAFMRHALAPLDGSQPRETGVTAETLGPCETQRNLNEVGRADARRIGDILRREAITFDHVFTSKWCRCRETAELIVGRPV